MLNWIRGETEEGAAKRNLQQQDYELQDLQRTGENATEIQGQMEDLTVT